MQEKRMVSRQVRYHVAQALFDEADTLEIGVAIYSLADPRDLRVSRYIGQTSVPRRRFLQHLNAARLWLPDELPWYVQKPKLRPLYDWIRSLYKDDRRLPSMIVHEWARTADRANLAERARIYQCLVDELPLLNSEQETLGKLWSGDPTDAIPS